MALFAALAAVALAQSTAKSTGAKQSIKSTKSTTGTKSTKSTAAKTTAAKPAAAKPAAAKSTTAKRTSSKTGAKQNVSSYHAPQQQPTQDRYREIQQALADKGYFGGPVDGNWGPASMDALKRFQHDQNLIEDGKVGSLSLIALGLGPKRAAVADAAPPTQLSPTQPTPTEPPSDEPSRPEPQ